MSENVCVNSKYFWHLSENILANVRKFLQMSEKVWHYYIVEKVHVNNNLSDDFWQYISLVKLWYTNYDSINSVINQKLYFSMY